MTSPSVSEQSQPVVKTTPVAGFWHRVAAFLIDFVVLGAAGMLFGSAVYRWAVTWGDAGRLLGFVVALLYFGLLNSRVGGGQTLGKRLLGTKVIDRGGNALSPMRSVLRFLVIAIPCVCVFDVDPAPPEELSWQFVSFVSVGGPLAIATVAGVGGALAYLFVFNRRARQSLHDLAAGSFVIRRPTAAIPDGLATSPLHLIVIGCWLGLFGLITVVAAIAPSPTSGAVEAPKLVNELQIAIKTQLGLPRVTAKTGQTSKPGASTTSFLQIDAQSDDIHDDLSALAPRIADAVLDRQPDLLGNRMLIIRVWRGFDFGPLSWREMYRQALDLTTWREILHRQSRKI
jgi:uncharacterized RDD family membrane protein YckC